MNIEDQRRKLTELAQIEDGLKLKRDYKSLIDHLHRKLELIETAGSMEQMVYAIGMKAYCYARLGQSAQAESTLSSLSGYQLFFGDTLFRIVVLVSLFKNMEPTKIRSNLMLVNTIKSWLQDPGASKDLSNIVFDYADIVGNIPVFQNSRLNKRQHFFPDELIEAVFVGMQRNNDTKIYYNRELNDVQQEVEGYLISLLADDQVAENRRLYNRIMNFDTCDNVVNEIHFLIPRLQLTRYLNTLSSFSKKYPKLDQFIVDFKSQLLKEYSNYVDSIDELSFGESIAQSFFQKIVTWQKLGDMDFSVLKELLHKTMKKISLEYLQSVNN
jgi:hypothetical protein